LIKKLISLFLLFAFCSVFGQHPIYTQFSEKDDLPDIEFYNMMEDSQGFIWLAADRGFYRYDGNQFKLFTNKEKRGLSVFEPKEDHLGRVWCCNITGQFFYVENDKLVTFIDLGKKIKWQLGSFIVTEKYLLVFTSKNVYKISLETKKIEKSVHLTDLSLGNPYQFKDKIYITTGNSITMLDADLNMRKQITSEAIEYDLVNRTIGKTTISGYKGRTYMQFTDRDNESNLYIFDVNSGQYDKVVLEKELQKSHIVSISFYENRMFLCTYSGLWLYTVEPDGTIRYKNRYFKNQYATKILVDKSKNYWVTTLRNGVFVIPNINNYTYDFPSGVEDFKCLEKINDDVFFYGTSDGKAGFYNMKTNTIDEIHLKDNTAITAASFDTKQQLLYISQQNTATIYNLQTKTHQNSYVFVNSRTISYLDSNTYFFTVMFRM